MLDPFDYKEPSCPLSDGRKFYYPSADDPVSEIPVRRVIEKLDGFFAINDVEGAGKFLRHWEAEAKDLHDLKGELSIQSELMGFCRKQGDEKAAMSALERALYLVDRLNIGDTVSAATVYLNAATVYKTFGKPFEALSLYERAGAIYERELDWDDPLVAGLYNNSALALCDLGRYEEAERLFTDAAAITSLRDATACDEAVTYVNMADLYAAWKGEDSDEIENCLAAAKEIFESPRPTRDGYYAFVTSKCAPAFRHYGDAEYADTLEERSNKIYEGA